MVNFFNHSLTEIQLPGPHIFATLNSAKANASEFFTEAVFNETSGNGSIMLNSCGECSVRKIFSKQSSRQLKEMIPCQ